MRIFIFYQVYPLAQYYSQQNSSDVTPIPSFINSYYDDDVTLLFRNNRILLTQVWSKISNKNITKKGMCGHKIHTLFMIRKYFIFLSYILTFHLHHFLIFNKSEIVYITSFYIFFFIGSFASIDACYMIKKTHSFEMKKFIV